MSQNETSGTVAVDNQKIKTKQMVLIALMTAVTCVLGPLSIPLPFSPVPISLTNFAIFLAIFVLGMKNGTISFIIYLLLGAVGVPVFSSFRGGLQVLAGPTGGYLIGFIFLALIMGFALDHFDRKLGSYNHWNDHRNGCMLCIRNSLACKTFKPLLQRRPYDGCYPIPSWRCSQNHHRSNRRTKTLRCYTEDKIIELFTERNIQTNLHGFLFGCFSFYRRLKYYML